MNNKKGLALLFVLIVLVALVGITLAFWYMTNSGLMLAGAELNNAQAFYLAEAGRAKARYAVTTGAQPVPYTETDTALGSGTYTVTVVYADPPTNQYVTITSDGYVPNSTKPAAHRQVVEKNASWGGGNLSLAAAATSSGSPGGHPASDAKDGNQSTYCQFSDKNCWLRLDYGTAKTVSKVVVTGGTFTTCVVRYSNNGSSWTNVSGASGSLTPNGGTQTFTPFTQRYIRLNITTAAKNQRANEFESYSGSGSGTLGKGSFTTSL